MIAIVGIVIGIIEQVSVRFGIEAAHAFAFRIGE